jgi:multimeric flavodoxin WrbA
MKIVAINASHRGDQGYTRFLIDLLFQGAVEAGAECEVVTLARLRLNRCQACDNCQQTVQVPVDPAAFTPHCVWDLKDDAHLIFEKMAAANLLIYATPIQIFHISGLMKVFLDRLYALGHSSDLRLSEAGLMFHYVDHRIVSKPFVPLFCCGNLEAETPRNALAYFRTFSRFMDAPIVGELVRNGAELAGHGKDTRAAERFPRLQKIYAAYQEAGRELACDGHIRKVTQRRANQEIIPVPLFSLWKRIPVKAVKEGFLRRARKMSREQQKLS